VGTITHRKELKKPLVIFDEGLETVAVRLLSLLLTKEIVVLDSGDEKRL
jgi:hypothetical protein